MDYDTIALTKLKEEEMRLRQQCHARGPRPANEAMTPQIRDGREQLVHRRTRQPGTLHQNARLNEERAAGSVRLFILAAFRPFQFSHNLQSRPPQRELRQHCGTSGVGNRDLVTTFPVKLKNIGAHIQTFRAKANT